MSTDLATLDLCTLADRVRDQEVSAEEVTKFAIARAEALQPALNAFIRLEAETAITRAQAIDTRITRGEDVGRLAGVPLAHKDMFYREGMPTSCGSKMRCKAPGMILHARFLDLPSHSLKNGYGSPASTNFSTRLEYFNTSVSFTRQSGA